MPGRAEYTIIDEMSHQCADISDDGVFLYIAVEIPGADPSYRLLRVVLPEFFDPPDSAWYCALTMFDPGVDSESIAVVCGDELLQLVWVFGDFGAGVKVRVSIDDGATWTTKDPGSWAGNAYPGVVGPYWDDLMLIATDGDDDMHETEDGGLNWLTLNAGLPFDIGGMDRLDINLDEIVIGSDADKTIQYSPNNAATFEDVTDAGMPNVQITSVIVG